MTEATRKIVETWDGPVCVEGDNYYSDMDEAVTMIVDHAYPCVDPLQMPEYVECCDIKSPELDAASIIESMDNYEGNVHTEDNYASQAVDEKMQAELQKLLNKWLEEIP